MTDQVQQPKELTPEEEKMAKERFEQGLCPVCGKPVPWECRGTMDHLRHDPK